jgi:glycerophosphoryl diester phosphodiesterase
MDVRLVLCLVVVVPGALSGYNYQREFDHGLERIETKRPLNIAQRGASGVFPEHTLPAYTQAIEDGADFIECDLAVTLDREFVCRHDPWLSESTNIALISKHAKKQRTLEFDYYGTAKNITDWFVQDFTLAELKKLRADQPKQQRNQAFDGKFQLLTLDEFLDIAEEGGVGVVIDLEWPSFTNSLEYFENGFEEALVKALNKRGYSKSTDPVILQSFELESLQILSALTELPLAKRVHLGIEATDDLLFEYSKICYAVVAWKCAVADHYGPTNDYKNNIRDINDLVGRIQRAGMKVRIQKGFFLLTF